jgi:hypothetical protein
MNANANATPDTQDRDLDRIARRRAGVKMGWYIHATVYIAVNLLLAMLASLGDRNWAVFPAVGWGIGLAIHGAVVFLVASGLQERLVQAERRRLVLQRDPW